jgi:predicted DNA binding CopG/RHH family protein
MKKKIPIFESDEEAERFVETADLSEYNLSHFRPVRFEFEAKAAQVNMRMPKPLLDAVKERAELRGIPYTRFIREVLEREISRPPSGVEGLHFDVELVEQGSHADEEPAHPSLFVGHARLGRLAARVWLRLLAANDLAQALQEPHTLKIKRYHPAA